jgi:hypothetical protein
MGWSSEQGGVGSWMGNQAPAVWGLVLTYFMKAGGEMVGEGSNMDGRVWDRVDGDGCRSRGWGWVGVICLVVWVVYLVLDLGGYWMMYVCSSWEFVDCARG